MLAYARGNADAFERLYARHKGALYQYMVNSCGNEAQAHELYQDVWLRVIKSRESYQIESPFKAWLYRIARNRLIDYHRGREKQPSSSPAPRDNITAISTLVAGSPTPDETASMSERAHRLNHALQKLPVVQREVILLRHIAGMSVKEVAEAVNEGAETVKSRLRYAVVKLRSHLQELS